MYAPENWYFNERYIFTTKIITICPRGLSTERVHSVAGMPEPSRHLVDLTRALCEPPGRLWHAGSSADHFIFNFQVLKSMFWVTQHHQLWALSAWVIRIPKVWKANLQGTLFWHHKRQNCHPEAHNYDSFQDFWCHKWPDLVFFVCRIQSLLLVLFT
jgi:hypothetical protein